VTVDLAAFLPEDTELVGGAPDPWDTGAPEPEVPSWARDHEAEPVAQVEPEPAPPPTAEAAPAPEGDALARIDRELAAVDDALVALDAGTPEASPLLRELLAD
jgi:hypothetical protein